MMEQDIIYDKAQGLEEKLIQVRVSLLDSLMNLSGELVLSRNQLLQGIGSIDMKSIELSGQRIDIITSELQETVMRTRMQHISTLFFQLDKVVSDLCKEQGKTANVEIEGREVELDKSVLESIRLPLTRLVENCVTKSIDVPGQREAQGKPPEAEFKLKAFHDAGQVNIVIENDGNALKLEEIDWETLTEVETLGGTIESDSIQEKGSRVTIKLPLTLVIIPTQIVSVGDETFAIPQSNLSELIRIPAEEVKNRIELVGDAEVIRLRGEILPLVNFSKMFDIQRTYPDPESGEILTERREAVADRRCQKFTADGVPVPRKFSSTIGEYNDRQARDRRTSVSSTLNICIVFAGEYKYGLVIDSFLDSEEIVVKPLGRHLKDFRSFIGATIMGDGKAALILDILNIAQNAGLSDSTSNSLLAETMQTTDDKLRNIESLVIFKNNETEYFAAGLDAVDRIERLAMDDIEKIGKSRVVQYRGGALPLVELADFINVDPVPEKEHMEAIVFSVMDKTFGLLVTPPIDTLEVTLELDDATLAQEGVKGSMIINEHTTLLLDLDKIADKLKEQGL